MKIKFKNVDIDEVPQFFKDRITQILLREGEWSDDVNDEPTKWGIIQGTADEFEYPGKLEDISEHDAAKLWCCHSWFKPRYDLICDVSEMVASTVIDTSGPAGTSVSSKHLQRALNAMNDPIDDLTKKYRYGDDIAEDGLIGMRTASRLRAYLDHRGEEGEKVLSCLLNCFQAYHYYLVTVKNPGKRDFMYGWNRERVWKDMIALTMGKPRG